MNAAVQCTSESHHYCVSQDNTLIIKDATCEDGAIELVGGYSKMEGRVKVCFNGEWTSVCAEGWSERESSVLCSSLGVSSELGI